MDETSRLLRDQAGVVARRQLLALETTDATDLARMRRRRELVEVHRGIYVEHTGPLTWQQRAWAAVLWAWPAALCGESALRAADGPGRADRETDVIHVVVDRDRRLEPPPGVVVHRRAGYADQVRWNLGPPRLRYEEAALDLALAAPDDLAAVAALADACGSRRTTAQRLLASLDARPWARRRDWTRRVLQDVADGTCSVLEHAYLEQVERAHGLPVGSRQVLARSAGRTMWQDVAYEELGLLVELDSRLFHSSVRQRDRDLDRDLDQAVDAHETLRLGWGQVVDRPCRTAARVGAVLQRRGWTGMVSPCEKCGGPDQPG
ncbi:hypothetical protein I601_0986 [Nocardioides dokdonensis FR1436]|uniref:Uncharacterized protein n=1 Tax=Nocardioides dokdonensis FR1436 TaxID=1300347 RepID=A0A1A9GGH7_9ACTN|nr:type IV toxin-antitoxin system AbiEi family antitoxin domain-containing protein [Nocardioides dokdonensis]ANH37429.1 hypothetical protein I601_0986 [Nocardioides dokdonensis FR1436]